MKENTSNSFLLWSWGLVGFILRRNGIDIYVSVAMCMCSEICLGQAWTLSFVQLVVFFWHPSACDLCQSMRGREGGREGGNVQSVKEG